MTRRQLLTACLDDRLASAYIFEGPQGSGKLATAYALARAALCHGHDPSLSTVQESHINAQTETETDAKNSERGCGQCRTCIRVREGTHPDVRVHGPRDEGVRNLKIETVRNEILPFARHAPFEGSHAFIIVKDADICFPFTQVESANALLKALEEPRDAVHWILLAHQASTLLGTIQSRCQRIRFSCASPIAIAEKVARSFESKQPALPKAPTDQAEHELFRYLAQGSLHRVEQLEEIETDSLTQDIIDLDLAFPNYDNCDHPKSQGRIPSKADPGQHVILAERLAKHPQLGLMLEAWATLYRDISLAHTDAEPSALSMPSLAEYTQTHALDANESTRRGLLLLEARGQLNTQTNTQIVLEALFTRLMRPSDA